ncbi:MAG: hypothetical protein ACLUOI_24345 [Eisenbergiella sp.]
MRTLIAVSKTKPCHAGSMYGHRDFGEIRYRSWLTRRAAADDIRWHMIGHLQRNKVKYKLTRYMIHSVDSLRLAEEISKEAVKRGSR